MGEATIKPTLRQRLRAFMAPRISWAEVRLVVDDASKQDAILSELRAINDRERRRDLRERWLASARLYDGDFARFLAAEAARATQEDAATVREAMVAFGLDPESLGSGPAQPSCPPEPPPGSPSTRGETSGPASLTSPRTDDPLRDAAAPRS